MLRVKNSVEVDPANIQGEVKKIIFRSPDGYTVMAVQIVGGPEVTLVGNMPPLSLGMNIRAVTQETHNAKYNGVQYKVEAIEETGFRTTEGLIDYLATFPGIGVASARLIANHLGEDALQAIDAHPEVLYDVPGLPASRAQGAVEYWTQQRGVNQVMAKLMKFNIKPNLAMKIYKHFQGACLEVLEQNPYRLTEVHGIGFLKADEIALKNGLAKDSPERVAAAIVYALENVLNGKGHCYLTARQLVDLTVELLRHDVNGVRVMAGIKTLEQSMTLRIVDDRVYLLRIYMAEQDVAKMVHQITSYKGGQISFETIEQLEEYMQARGIGNGIQFAPEQVEALFTAINSRMCIITGGPGVGKTTIVRALCQLMDSFGLEYALCSPTGKASKRLTESTGQPAMTIHRLLGFQKDGGFAYGPGNPLPIDCLVVDEFSMVDIQLAKNLLQALEDNDRVIMVGDANQLPSVGPGNVLHDLIMSGLIPVVRLKKIFRQSEGSMITLAAHSILNGQVPELLAPRAAVQQRRNLMFVGVNPNDEHNVSQLIDHIKTMVKEFTGPVMQIPFTDIQVLTPMRAKGLGVSDLNPHLQELINPQDELNPKAEIRSESGIYRTGDKVMQLRNDYDKGVFNGDTGYIATIAQEGNTNIVHVTYPDLQEPVPYLPHEMDDLQLAYACTIHKFQGSECPVVIMVAHNSQWNMMRRKLFYTGMTRAKKICLIAGTKTAVSEAITNTREEKRNTTLAVELRKRGYESQGKTDH